MLVGYTGSTSCTPGNTCQYSNGTNSVELSPPSVLTLLPTQLGILNVFQEALVVHPEEDQHQSEPLNGILVEHLE